MTPVHSQTVLCNSNSARQPSQNNESPLREQNQGERGNLLSSDLGCWRSVRCAQLLNPWIFVWPVRPHHQEFPSRARRAPCILTSINHSIRSSIPPSGLRPPFSVCAVFFLLLLGAQAPQFTRTELARHCAGPGAGCDPGNCYIRIGGWRE